MKSPIPFDEVGNLITTKSMKLGDEKEKVIPKHDNGLIHVQGKIEGNSTLALSKSSEFKCQYCNKEWNTKISKTHHEIWCEKNPNKRAYRKDDTIIKPKKPKISKLKESKIKTPKSEIDYKELTKIHEKMCTSQEEKFTVEELRKIDKKFGLTDEQIINYVRGK